MVAKEAIYFWLWTAVGLLILVLAWRRKPQEQSRVEEPQEEEDFLARAPEEVKKAYAVAACGTPYHAPVRRAFFAQSSSSSGAARKKPRLFSADLIERCRAACTELDRECYDPTEAPVRLKAQRRKALTSTIKQLLGASREALLVGLDVRFEDEPGWDAGGITKEYLTEVAEEATTLFAPLADGSLTLRKSEKLKELLALGRLAGAVAAWAARRVANDEQKEVSSATLDLPFTRALAKLACGDGISADDVRAVDPQLYDARLGIARRDLDALKRALDVDELVFAWYDPTTGEPTEELRQGGFDVRVTNANVDAYVRETAEFYLIGNARREVAAFLGGLKTVLGDARSHLKFRDLQLLWNGVQRLDPTDWETHSIVDVPASADAAITARLLTAFWTVVREMTPDARSKLLLFATGSATLPPPGTFAGLHPAFRIVIDPSTPENHLPTAHSCANQIHLPLYHLPGEEDDLLKQKLLAALDLGIGSFGLT